MLSPSEEVKNRLNIVEVISGYVKLQKSGTTFRALCPFHKEKTPSFHVSREKQIWHCFGCGEGGDVFKFVMKMDGIEFPDALRLLANRAGVVLRAEDPKLKSERARLIELTKVAMHFFEKTLESDGGGDVRQYLRDRAVADETRENFRLGYAPEEWDALTSHLRWKGFREQEVERAGLTIRTDRGWHDRFRNRVMFPLFDIHGNPVGFSGRIYEPRAKDENYGGKYVNTPETLIYQKSRLLYGLDRAKNAIREKGYAVLVEGQFDLILAHQAGLPNTVATSGTALTEDHARLLRRHTDTVRITFDRDVAGEKASERAFRLLLQYDIKVQAIILEGSKDPADLIVQDPALWQRKVNEAISVPDYYIQDVITRYPSSTQDEKSKLIDKVLSIIYEMQNAVEQAACISKLLSGIRGIQEGWNERVFYERMRQLAARSESLIVGRREEPDSRPRPRTRWTDIEEYLLALLWKRPEAFRAAVEALSGDLFEEPHTSAIFVQLRQHAAAERFSADISEALPEELRTEFNRMVLKAEEYLSAVEGANLERETRERDVKEINFFARELTGRRLRREQRRIAEALKETDQVGRAKEREALLREFSELTGKLQKSEKMCIV